MKILTLLSIFSRSSMRYPVVFGDEFNSKKPKKVGSDSDLLKGVKIENCVTHEKFMIIWRHGMLLFKTHVSCFFRWYDGEMMIAINCNWVQISIVSWIRDILVRIRRSVPLTYGSRFILGSGSGFKSGSDTGSKGQKSTESRSAILLFECSFTFFLLVDGRIQIRM
jgi:hypothetical protein